MVTALVVNLHAYDVKRRGGHCDQSDGAINVAMMLATGYFALFTWFFINAYMWKSVRSTKTKGL